MSSFLYYSNDISLNAVLSISLILSNKILRLSARTIAPLILSISLRCPYAVSYLPPLFLSSGMKYVTSI